MSERSPLHAQRLQYQPKLPKAFYNLRLLTLEPLEQGSLPSKEIAFHFPHTFAQPELKLKRGSPQTHTPKRVGVIFSGGQAPGGHNVICGLFDALLQLHPESKLYGFLNGPSGLLQNKSIPITREFIQLYRNQGGFDMIGSGRTRISKPEELRSAQATADALQLDGIVVIGGDDSNTNAAFLAEYFKEQKLHTAVVGVPKTIDGDLKGKGIPISFGFDTASKTYAESIGSIARDALSARKYYHFIKLMGRSASHVTLECALQTHPNYTFIGEEIQAKGLTFRDSVKELSNLICARSAAGMDFGIVLLPEGLIEFIPEFKLLIGELNTLLATHDAKERLSWQHKLSEPSALCFSSLPLSIQEQLIGDRDPHGNVQVAKIETERLFIDAITVELAERKKLGLYGGKFNAQSHYLGYEGRSCFPSNFDCEYCYTLGHIAALLINFGASGYLASATNLTQPVEEWQCGGVPLTQMMGTEEREGIHRPVITKALVDLKGAPFESFAAQRSTWGIENHYRYPGPIQFDGIPDVEERVSFTLRLESEGD